MSFSSFHQSYLYARFRNHQFSKYLLWGLSRTVTIWNFFYAKLFLIDLPKLKINYINLTTLGGSTKVQTQETTSALINCWLFTIVAFGKVTLLDTNKLPSIHSKRKLFIWLADSITNILQLLAYALFSLSGWIN